MVTEAMFMTNLGKDFPGLKGEGRTEHLRAYALRAASSGMYTVQVVKKIWPAFLRLYKVVRPETSSAQLQPMISSACLVGLDNIVQQGYADFPNQSLRRVDGITNNLCTWVSGQFWIVSELSRLFKNFRSSIEGNQRCQPDMPDNRT